MFEKKFFDSKIEPRCEYCSGGFLSADGSKVLCKKKGVVERGFHCKAFDYDPLLREPKAKAPKLPEFKPEDFAL